MKQRHTRWLAIVLALGMFQSTAFAGKVVDRLLHDPRPEEYLVDEVGALFAADQQALEDLLARYDAEKKVRFQIVTVMSLSGHDVEDTCQMFFENWQLDQASERGGMLLVFSVLDRKIFFDSLTPTGEKVIVEEKVRDLIERSAVPLLRRYAYGNAIITAVHGVMKLDGFDPAAATKEAELSEPKSATNAASEIAPEPGTEEPVAAHSDRIWVPLAIALAVVFAGAGFWRLIRSQSGSVIGTGSREVIAGNFGMGSAGAFGAGDRRW